MVAGIILDDRFYQASKRTETAFGTSGGKARPAAPIEFLRVRVRSAAAGPEPRRV